VHAQRPLVLDLPRWLTDRLRDDVVLPGRPDRMRFAIELARENVRQRTGGPFGAVVVEVASGRLLGAGVNRVVPLGFSCAHAEVLALGMAQVDAGTYDLAAPGRPDAELVTSVEPCVMCIGAVLWSGARSLVCGASDADATGIGFDEGPKPADWAGEFEARGIAVVCGVLREEAAAVLTDYAAAGGPIYNAGRR
jgi:tRNA(Arg) A34 adenosine deaminase TadA